MEHTRERPGYPGPSHGAMHDWSEVQDRSPPRGVLEHRRCDTVSAEPRDAPPHETLTGRVEEPRAAPPRGDREREREWSHAGPRTKSSHDHE